MPKKSWFRVSNPFEELSAVFSCESKDLKVSSGKAKKAEAQPDQDPDCTSGKTLKYEVVTVNRRSSSELY